MNKKLMCVLILILSGSLMQAQNQKADTIVVKLGKSSKVVLTVQDRNDVAVLKTYDFQSLFDDLIRKLEQNDTTPLVMVTPPSNTGNLADTTNEVAVNTETTNNYSTSTDNHKTEIVSETTLWRGTTNCFTIDLGTNNYLSDGKFPNNENAPYAVRPWGSWYVALNSTQRTRLGHYTFLEWGLGVSWYNFKFEEDNVVINKDDSGLSFTTDTRDVDFRKSKLTASYINFSLVPVIDLSGENHKSRMWEQDNLNFRIGLGPYVGYRIGSYSKITYKEDGDRKRDKNHDSFYLENIRYGARLQVGFRGTDLFLNYDMNDLFSTDKGPSLNAFSFGVIL